MGNFISDILGLASDVDSTVPFQAPFWADPKIWIIISIVLIVMTVILIYYKILTGNKGL